MIAGRHTAPKHDRGVPATADDRLDWRRLGRFIAVTVVVSFVLNEIWEMAQMSAYVETAQRPWRATLALCTQAAVGDVAIILGICAVGALAAGDPGWGLRHRWNTYATAALLGLICATLVEHAALASERWTYTESMPVVPLLGAGLWPLLQLTLLPALTFWIAHLADIRSLRASPRAAGA